MLVEPHEAGALLLDLLRARYPETDREALLAWVRGGQVRVDGRPAGLRRPMRAGEVITLPAAPAVGRRALRAQLEVVYEDAAVLAVAKPAGLPVHRAAGSEDDLTSRVAAWLAAASQPAGFKVGPAHRLDVETSGLVLFGRTPRAQRRLARAFESGGVRKRYLALVAGHGPEAVRVEAPIEGRAAASAVRTLARGDGYALVEVAPETGRRHQVRRHLAGLGFPILGDRRYRDPRTVGATLAVPRVMLHAAEIALRHPTRDAELHLRAPLPEDLRRVCAEAGIAIPPAS